LTDIVVAFDFFYDYPSYCWSVINGEVTLKEDAETLRADALALKAANRLAPIKVEKIAEVDTKTAASIIALIGDAVNQRNLTAKATQLTLKETRGTISEDETIMLNTLNGIFGEVEVLRETGNALEASIDNVTTQEELDALLSSS
jgi:phosphotransferase system IIB component